jgi:hypothetical protein
MKDSKFKWASLVLAFSFIAYVYFYPPICRKKCIEDERICMNYDSVAPSKLASGLVYNMITNYKNNQLKSIQNYTPNPLDLDAHAIWFDLDTIKKFIYHIEKGVKQNAGKDLKLGLRIYYASYPIKDTWKETFPDLSGFLQDTLTEKYEKMHTLVMIPTFTKENIPYDFDPFQKETFEKGLPIYNEQFNTIPVTALTSVARSASSGDPEILQNTARNHGVLFPPGNTLGEAFK